MSSMIIAGQSHAVRWKQLVKDDVLPAAVPSENTIGFGGAPVWSRRLLSEAAAAAGANRRIAVFVPDLRFGNGICLNAKALAGPLMQDGFSGVRSC